MTIECVTICKMDAHIRRPLLVTHDQNPKDPFAFS